MRSVQKMVFLRVFKFIGKSYLKKKKSRINFDQEKKTIPMRSAVLPLTGAFMT